MLVRSICTSSYKILTINRFLCWISVYSIHVGVHSKKNLNSYRFSINPGTYLSCQQCTSSILLRIDIWPNGHHTPSSTLLVELTHNLPVVYDNLLASQSKILTCLSDFSYHRGHGSMRLSHATTVYLDRELPLHSTYLSHLCVLYKGPKRQYSN